MNVIRTEYNGTNNHALVLPNKEWRRLINMITKKNDDIAAEHEIKKIKNERKAASKAITESWTSTTVNQRRKEIEKKQKLLTDIEATKMKRDEEIKLKFLEQRNEIVKKVRAKKWSEKDSTKAITRAIHYMEVLREREIQIKFNEAENARIMEEERLLKIAQNLEAEQYRKDQLKDTLKHAETKKTNAGYILKELKEREDIRHNVDLLLHQEGKAESQRIAKDIEKEIKEKKSKIITEKKNMLNNLNENRANIAKKNKLHKLEEHEENMVVSIMDEAKKKMAKIKKYKEIQLLKEKQLISEKLAEKAYNNQVKKTNATDHDYQNAIKEKEHQYLKEDRQRKKLAEKIKKDINDFKKLFDEESRKEKERLTLSTEWESKKHKQDTIMLINLKESNCRKKIDEMNRFREQLDVQCDNNVMANKADKQEELKQYEIHKKKMYQEDEQFMTCINKSLDKYKKAGISVVPLLKTIEDYEKNKQL